LDDPDPSKADLTLFQALLEGAPDAIVIIDGRGRISLVNAQTEKLFGYPRSELLGQSVETLIPERLRASHSRHRHNYFAAPGTRPIGVGLELFGRRKDGTEFPVEISLSPLQTRRGILVMSAIRDISQRKRAEAKFRGLLELAPDAMVIVRRGHDLLYPIAGRAARSLFTLPYFLAGIDAKQRTGPCDVDARRREKASAG
jgi:PAS domain S-box-containing protein